MLISPEDLKNRLGEVKILSVIENTDLSIPFETGYRIPYTKFNIEEFNPNASQDVVVVCNKGITSYEITQRIKSAYPQLNVLSLEGGIEKF